MIRLFNSATVRLSKTNPIISCEKPTLILHSQTLHRTSFPLTFVTNPKSLAEWPDGTRKWNWSGSGEPNNAGNEDCANITRSDGTWNDLRCSRNQYGIIEFD